MLAAALVVITHVGLWTGASGVDGSGRLLARGDIGVAVFFALSAFLLTRHAAAGRQEETRAYWWKRLGRILPGYWVALAAVVVGTSWWGWATSGTASPIVRCITHLFVMQGLTAEDYQAFGQTWSLTTEVCFYALVPFIRTWLMRCRARERSPMGWLWAISLVSILIQGAAASRLLDVGRLGLSVAGHASWFAVGVALAWLSEHERLPREATRRYVAVAGAIFAVGCTPLCGPVGLEAPKLGEALAKETLYAAFAGCLLAATICARDELWASERVQYAGDLSYGLFLWHVPVLAFIFEMASLDTFRAPFAETLTLTVLVSLLLAHLSWHLIERPALAWAHRRAAAQAPVPTVHPAVSERSS